MSEKSTPASPYESVALEVNGKKIALNPFLRSLLGNMMMAAVRTLKGVEEEPRQVTLRIGPHTDA